MGLLEGITAFAKLELYNPAGGVKDRVGLAMVNQAEKDGILKPGGAIIEATAGNTGLGVSFAALGRGYRLIFVIPDKFSVEKQTLIRALGAEVINTPAAEGMAGAIAKAEQLRVEIPGSVMLGQFTNPANPLVHYETTGPEIWDDLDGEIDYFVAGVGSGGTFSGVSRYLKEQNPNIKAVLADPVGSTMGGGAPGVWDIEGIGNLAIPQTMDMSLIDLCVKVDSAEAVEMSRVLVKREGIFAGPSSGAAMAAVLKLAEMLKSNGVERSNIVTVFPDRGARYFSKHLYE
jgi:cysteine synthase A